MKKLLALILALMLALGGVAAFADTVYTKVTIDPDVAKELLPGFGIPEDQMAMIDPILSLVNALGVKVVTVEDGAEVALDLNGKDALTLGWATDDAGATVVSTLFPNFVLTVSQETINQMMEQFMANMPGAGGEGGMGGFDFAAMGETLGGHYVKWFQACAAAGKPGDPVPGEYEFYEVSFDTMMPVEVDMPAIKAATQTLLDDLLADPAAMNMMKGMAQGMAQSSGGDFDGEDFDANFKAGFEEWMAHFPDTASAEFYTNSEEEGIFYLYGESAREDSDEPAVIYDMLFLGQQDMLMNCQTFGEGAMNMTFEMHGSDMRMDFSMEEMYFGLGLSFPENEFDLDIYYMNPDAPLLCVQVKMDEAGERTLSLDADGKTVVAVEDAMSDQSGEVVQGLLGDVMGNGLGALVGVLSEEAPEVMSLFGAFSGAMAG